MTERDVLRLIRERVKDHDGNVARTAKSLGGVSRQYLHMVLVGRCRPTLPKLLKALGLRYVVTECFEPVP